MLFHVTSSHIADNCAAINIDAKNALIEGTASKKELEKKYKVSLVTGGFDMAGHRSFFILDGSSAMNISLFCMDFMGHTGGFKQTFRIVPIENIDTVIGLFSCQQIRDEREKNNINNEQSVSE